MDLFQQLKAMMAVVHTAQLLHVRGFGGGIHPAIERSTWDALQAAIEQLPDEMRVKFATAELT